ncbi:MAG: 8-oxoguanine deaminase [Acidobacteria bacterium]|nr:8-oxoguanine deaminase [Acidobacteriota bacterium]
MWYYLIRKRHKELALILLKNCYMIATFNDKNEELKGMDILIRDNRIEKIRENISLTPEEENTAEIIDASRMLVIPGMVNTHHHFYQTLTRNLPGAQNAKLFDWLVYLYPIWGKLNREAVYWSTALATAELLKTGCTCSTDHMYLYPKDFDGDVMATQFEAADKTGIRFAPTRGSMTRGKSQGGLPPDHVVQTPKQVIDDMYRVVNEFNDAAPLSMRRVILAPCSPFSVEEHVMVKTAEMGRELDVPIHTHLCETVDEEDYCLSTYGKRPLAAMQEWGWTGPNVFYAHGIWFNDDELHVLAETGTGVAHCPSSNMRLGSGIARIREMMDLGIRVGIGVDGSASNDASDMLGEARNAMLLQRVKYGADALTARETLKLAIQGGAELLGFDRIGRIEPGYGADLALFDMKQFQYAGSLSDPVAAVLFTGFSHETAYTIVNGKVVVRNGNLTGMNENEIAGNVNRIAGKLLTP